MEGVIIFGLIALVAGLLDFSFISVNQRFISNK